MLYFGCLFLDNEKDMIVDLYRDGDRLLYELKTPNHHSGNLIRNFARLSDLPLSTDKDDMPVSRGEVPCYIDAENREVYILRFANTKVANIYPDGRIERKASVPAIAKTLMSQTKDYRGNANQTIFKTYILRDYKFRSDLHTHMNGNLEPDVLIALGIAHQIRYPRYYVKKLGLKLTKRQDRMLTEQHDRVARQFVNSGLQGKYLERRINDNTFINFADLILNNLGNAEQNIVAIRNSLAVLKDGQAVFTNLEKVYLYRYVFTKGKESEKKIELKNMDRIPDTDVRNYLGQMLRDRENPEYWDNSIFQDCLLWIARQYSRQGIEYVEISDTTLVKKYESLNMLVQVHQVMPAVYRETGVLIRFLAAMRRIPLTIIKDAVTPADYLEQNLSVLSATALDPYVAGCDFVGEEINDISELKPLFKEIDKIAARDPDFVIRVHAGENDALRDNVAHSIACVKDSLAPGQPMPKMRIGHGLYTYGLKTQKGRALLREIRENGVVLEFQLTSNVRLNNLNALENHPLHDYLRAGIGCVQGTDGAALYGTNPIDEQLSLEKLLGLSNEELKQMKDTETAIIENSRRAFRRKDHAFRELLAGRTLGTVLLGRMEEYEDAHSSDDLKLRRRGRVDATVELRDRIRELPWDCTPVILAGGSFNTEKRTTKITEEGKKQIDELLSTLDPHDFIFVVGHSLRGYERYLIERNKTLGSPARTGSTPDAGNIRNAENTGIAGNSGTAGGPGKFQIYCFVPSLITGAERNRILQENVSVRISPESESAGIYKSFNYEIFERRPSIVIAMDGNSAGENLIQEARNGKGGSAIFIWDKAVPLRKKAESLEGYVHMFGKDSSLSEQMQEQIGG